MFAGLEERANDPHGGPSVADPAVRGPLVSKRVVALWEVTRVKDGCCAFVVFARHLEMCCVKRIVKRNQCESS